MDFFGGFCLYVFFVCFFFLLFLVVYCCNFGCVCIYVGSMLLLHSLISLKSQFDRIQPV